VWVEAVAVGVAGPLASESVEAIEIGHSYFTEEAPELLNRAQQLCDPLAVRNPDQSAGFPRAAHPHEHAPSGWHDAGGWTVRLADSTVRAGEKDERSVPYSG
jgi:hypothetical protein